MRLRRQGDRLIAPHRGRPPVAPEGYEPDPGDPYVFLIKLPPCEYREERLYKMPCCDTIKLWCTKVNLPIKRIHCVERLCDNVKVSNNDNV
jgi:hypothetical protein